MEKKIKKIDKVPAQTAKNIVAQATHPQWHKNHIGHKKNYVRCRKNYIRHNSNYIRPFFDFRKLLKGKPLQRAHFMQAFFCNSTPYVFFATSAISWGIWLWHNKIVEQKTKGHECFTIHTLLPVTLFQLFLLDLLEMHTAYKQAICVSVLQMCCKFRNKQR